MNLQQQALEYERRLTEQASEFQKALYDIEKENIELKRETVNNKPISDGNKD